MQGSRVQVIKTVRSDEFGVKTGPKEVKGAENLIQQMKTILRFKI
jgi:hypothetical protein